MVELLVESEMANERVQFRSELEVESLSIKDFPLRAEPQNVLMCMPTFFDVKGVQNPFMEGRVGTVDIDLARLQWQLLKETFEKLGCVVRTIQPVEGLEDMVFAANQALVSLNDQSFFPAHDKEMPIAFLGQMRHEQRQREIPWYQKWFEANGYYVLTFDDVMGNEDFTPVFEGQGDAIWHPSRTLLWGGHGARTEEYAYRYLSSVFSTNIVLLKLSDPRFYHLDTCFSAIDEETVMIYEGAFDSDGLALIKHFFKKVISVSEKDALNFALNAVAINGNVILQKGSADTVEALKSGGFNPIEVDTSEFMKSGGSVFCLKMMVY